MNNVDLEQLEKERLAKLEEYQLDEASIQEFRSNIQKVDQEQSDQLGKELYQYVSKKNYSEIETELDKVREFIEKGANLEYKTENKGDFLLLLCARRNHLKTAILLIRAGANINQKNNYLTTSTMTSARHGNKEILEVLILLKADINAQCLDGDTALMSAKRHDQEKCFDMLKKAGARFGTKNLSNQTVKDIPSTTKFDFSGFLSFESCLDEKLTYEDIKVVLEEANRRMITIVGDFATDSSSKEPAKLKQKRIL